MEATMVEATTMAERTDGRGLGVPLPHLAAWRARKLLTQDELATAAGVSPITVKRAERGERVRYGVARKFAEALGVSTDDLRFREPGEA